MQKSIKLQRSAKNMGAGLCGSKPAVSVPNASDPAADSIRKVEDWLLEARQSGERGASPSSVTLSDKKVAKNPDPQPVRATLSASSDAADTARKALDLAPSSARSDSSTKLTTAAIPVKTTSPQAASSKQLWKNVRNVVGAAHGLRDKAAMVKPTEEQEEEENEDYSLQLISEQQARVYRSEFESVSAPKATMDFQKLQKLQVHANAN